MTAFPKPTKKVKTPKPLQRGRKSKNPLRRAHDKAWDAQSRYVRISNADWNGMVKCFTCDKVYPWKEMQLGHFIHDRLDFDLDNLHPQCAACNGPRHRGNIIEYYPRMVKLYGVEFVENLKIHSRETTDYKIADYEAIEIMYKEKLKGLEGLE